MKTVFAFLLLVTSVSWAQPRGLGCCDRPGRTQGIGLVEKLDLTENQREQFDKLRTSHEKRLISLRAEIQSLRIDLGDLLRDTKPDRAKIENAVKAISKSEAEMKLSQVAFWFEVNKLLTPEQQKTWRLHPGFCCAAGMGPGPDRAGVKGRMGRRHRMMMRDGACCSGR